MKKRYKYLFYCLALLLVLQLTAKYYLGLGSLPVYIKNDFYEYMYAPGQDLYRFGNHIQTNSLGMRSPEISKKDKVRVLKIGDSVINGGAHVDQDNLSSTQLTQLLTKSFAQNISVYNISAQSWGPDNAFAFIQQHGDFNANIFLLVFSSHDLHDNMHFKEVVGVHQAWPSAQPYCAFTDAWSRYAWPRIKSFFGGSTQEYDYLFDFDDSKINPGWAQFIQYCREKDIKLMVYLHATRTELAQKKYDKYGKQLIEMLEQHEVKCIRGIECITTNNAYRDEIHLNEEGHRLLTKALAPHLEQAIHELIK